MGWLAGKAEDCRRWHSRQDPKTGKVAYATILEFDNAAVASAFSQAVIDTVLKLDAHALDNVPLEDVII